MKHAIGQTQSGVVVYVDLIQSQAAKRIAHQPHLLSLVAEALQQATLHETDTRVECDMGRAVGYNFVIKAPGSDSVFYAQPLRDNTYMRFVKNGKPSSTKYVSMVLHQDKSGAYELDDVWLGRLRPPHPGTVDETAESKPYWATHAIVLTNELLQSATVTKLCPY